MGHFCPPGSWSRSGSGSTDPIESGSGSATLPGGGHFLLVPAQPQLEPLEGIQHRWWWERNEPIYLFIHFFILTNFPLYYIYMWNRQSLVLPRQCCGSVSMLMSLQFRIRLSILRPIRIRIRPQVLLMLENVGKYDFFLHFVTFIRRHRGIILNIMDIILNFLENCIV